MDKKLTFVCNHDPDCENHDEYLCRAVYLETWTADGIQEIMASNEEPGLMCAYCGNSATIDEETNDRLHTTVRQKQAEAMKAQARLL